MIFFILYKVPKVLILQTLTHIQVYKIELYQINHHEIQTLTDGRCIKQLNRKFISVGLYYFLVRPLKIKVRNYFYYL